VSALDRDAALGVLRRNMPDLYPEYEEALLSSLEQCVVPSPPQTIDRDTLRHELAAMFIAPPDVFDDDVAADAILALVQPAEGVVLTPGTEAFDLVDDALRYVQDQSRLDYLGRNIEWLEPRRDAVRTLIKRLEATS
jgi:hypothetical protein